MLGFRESDHCEDEMGHKRLTRQANCGELEAFNRLVAGYQDLVFRQASWMVVEPGAAEAITQRTFLLAYREIRASRETDLDCLLLKIVHRLCREGSGPDGASRVSHLNYALNPPVPSQVENTSQESLLKLPPDDREVVILVDLQGMSYAQTARILGTSIHNVKIRLAQARRQLIK